MAFDSILSELEVNAPQAFGRLQVFPLIQRREVPAPVFTLFSEALEARSVEISETSEAGNVPVLRLRSGDMKPILLIDGEELIGAKQNRILNASVLAAAGIETLIPVSCVEQGRWRYKSANFAGSDQTMFAKGRARKSARMAERYASRPATHATREEAERLACAANPTGSRAADFLAQRFNADQSEVWNDVSEKLVRMHVSSESSAMSDGFDRYESKLRAFDGAFPTVECQVGAVFAIDGKVMGVEYVCREDAFAKLFRKVLRSYSIDALEEEPGSTRAEASLADVETFLGRVGRAQEHSAPGVGLGSDVRLEGEACSGLALVHEGAVLHMAAFDSALAA